MTNLVDYSITVIRENQADTGAYIASPCFNDYSYCWFRDGAYIAYAMDLIGEHESARRFHEWAANVINRNEDVVTRCLEKTKKGLPLKDDDILHTRYTIEGEAGEDEWPNFQLDGFGTWLWCLQIHTQATGVEQLPDVWRNAVGLIVSYLSALWQKPNYDCWEEHPDKIHPYTLASIYGGLQAADTLIKTPNARDTANAAKEAVLKHGVINGRAVKHFGSDEVDASLLGLSTPYRMIEPDDPIMQSTVAWIEERLHPKDGGVHRYAYDTYYGGGEWVLLAAWLGWYYAEVKQWSKAQDLLNWVERQADDDGNLPEQVPSHLIDPDKYNYWRDRWGEIAQPLLWSHAKYLTLHQAIQAGAA